MSKESNVFRESELVEIENQLSFPTGEKGIEMSKMMHETNITMTRASINGLRLENMDAILELGHGNGGHIKELLSLKSKLSYIGLEISETMQEEARRINKYLSNSNDLQFSLYDGLSVPFADQSFTKIMTTNTLYFWQNPLLLMKELFRVLKPKGLFVIAFGQASFLEKLPFVRDKFTLYTTEEVLKLASEAGFKNLQCENKEDVVKSKTGELVTRKFSVLTLKRP